jgi:Spy/CpxP family protein refolding chaperone
MLAACAGVGLVAGGVTMAADSSAGFAGDGAAGGFSGWHYGGGFGERRWGGGFGLRTLGQVGLSDAQKATIIGLLKADRAKFQAVREEAQEARKALAQVNPGDANYNAALEDAAAKIGDAAKQRVELAGALRVSINDVLTSDQKAKLAAFKTQEEYRRVFGDDGPGRDGGRGGFGGGARPQDGQAQPDQ